MYSGQRAGGMGPSGARRPAPAQSVRGTWFLLLLAVTSAHAQGEWRIGRGTHYGGVGDPWNIMVGSCGYSYLDPAAQTGWDVAAMTDAVGEYSGSCGRCYEVKCNPMDLTDGYGATLDRKDVCYDADASAVVMITDVCPCSYPDNSYSNKRWCCGDYFHFDMSHWTFEKLAPAKFGVIGLQFREVPCGYTPEKRAKLPNGEQPMKQSVDKPWDYAGDKRPQTGAQPINPYTGEKDGKGSDGWSSYSGAPQTTPPSGGSTSGSNQQQDSNGSGDQQQQDPSWPSWAPATTIFGSGSLMKDWFDKWDISSFRVAGASGEGEAHCGTASGHGAASYQGPAGTFNGKKTMQFSVKKADDGNVPDFEVALISSSKGGCRSLKLRDLSPQWNGDWATFTVQLKNFAWDQHDWVSDPQAFWACSSSVGAWDVDQVMFKDATGSSQWLCVDELKVLG